MFSFSECFLLRCLLFKNIVGLFGKFSLVGFVTILAALYLYLGHSSSEARAFTSELLNAELIGHVLTSFLLFLLHALLQLSNWMFLNSFYSSTKDFDLFRK